MSDPSRLFTGAPPVVVLPNLPLGRELRPIRTLPGKANVPVDLNDKPVVLLAIGPGRSGTSTYLRWLAERALARNPDHTGYFAAVGERRDLTRYPFTVSQPERDGKPVFGQVPETEWLGKLLFHCRKTKRSAAVDFDGGDETLMNIVREDDALCERMEDVGMAVVAAYMLTARVSDLTVLATLEKAGFQPRATMLIRNQGEVPPTSGTEGRFDAISQHQDFKAAVDRGAVVIDMPHNYEAKAVEDQHLLFGHAASVDSPIGGFESDRVRQWLQAMEAAFEPVAAAGWLP